MMPIWNALHKGALLCLLFVLGQSTHAQGSRGARHTTPAPRPPAEVVHPGDVPGDVTPEHLQFLLDLGGDGKNKQLPLYMEAATQAAISEHAQVQKNGLIAAGLHVLHVPEKARRPRPNSRGGLTQAQRTQVAQMTAAETAEQHLRLRMLATGHHIANAMSQSELDGLLSQFESFHWSFLAKEIPEILDEWPSEGIFSKTWPNWEYVKPYGLEKDFYDKPEVRHVSGTGRGARVSFRSASYRDKAGMAIIIGGLFHGGFLDKADVVPAPPTGSTDASFLNSWRSAKLNDLKAKVLSVKEWMEFTSKYPIISEVNAQGELEHFVLQDGVKKPLNSALDSGIISPILKGILQRNAISGWLKFVGESKFGPRLVQFILQTTDLGKAIADTSVRLLEQILKNNNQRMVVKPEFLTHKFASAIQDFATKFDVKAFQNYTPDSAARTANVRDLGKAGLANSTGMSLFGKAFARAFVLEAAIDIAFRLGGAAYNGLGERVEVGGQTYSVSGRDRIQMTGDSGSDWRRQRAAAVDDAWQQWKREGLRNTAGYVAGGLTTVIATPFVFGVAAAAGAPTAGVGSVVVAVAGYAVVGAAAYAASSGARSLMEGVDDGVNLWRLDDRLKGIYSDMAVNRDGSVQDSETLVKKIVDAAGIRYINKQNMKYMVFVEKFDKVELVKENNLTHFKVNQDHGNFLDSERVSSWENYFKRGVTHVATLGISTLWRQFSDWRQGEAAKIEKREARILHDFYDLAGNQAQWDDFPDKIVTIGPIANKGVVFVGTPGDKIVMSGNNVIRGTEDEADLRILSNGLIMARNERNRERWVIKGKCSDFDVYVRREAGEGAGRYTCLNNSLRFLRHLNTVAESPVGTRSVRPAAATTPAGRTEATGALDEAFTVTAP